MIAGALFFFLLPFPDDSLVVVYQVSVGLQHSKALPQVAVLDTVYKVGLSVRILQAF